jgi:GntR family transcriptional regulator, transcriptional repressor for pyruvate dehydrogenase complex
MRLHPAMKSSGRKVIPFRTATMSTQIVAQVRDALFAKELHPGDFLGTEKDLAERFGVSRIVARDALRTLEAQGIVEIKVGAGGGARIARGNARLFAEALAVQLDLTGVSVGEIMDAQRAIECLAAELAAINSTAEDHARLRELIADAERRSDDVAEFTRLGREFHLAVAEASHNRVLVVQLISLQHVSWPARNPTLTPQVAQRILDVHKELASLVEIRDAAGARRLMDEHVKMIGARRVAEHRYRGGAFSGKVDTDLGFTRDPRSTSPKSAAADLGGFPQKMRPSEESSVEQDCC